MLRKKHIKWPDASDYAQGTTLSKRMSKHKLSLVIPVYHKGENPALASESANI